jgi:pimeloyl-ACP methyl ester carboxylesterase
MQEVLMFRWLKISMAVLLMLAFVPLTPALAYSNEDCDLYGTYSNGAKYCITYPSMWPMWNGDLVIFAHGYVPVTAPLDIPWSQMTFLNDLTNEPTSLPGEVNDMGFAFATTSYSVNGLAVTQGVSDILDLIQVFSDQVAPPNRVYLVGASEGGLVTTLAIERYPDAFAGGLAACGPIGDFRRQVDYWGDFRTVFDYLMDTPDFDVLPGTTVNIPKSLMSKWDSVYVSRVGSVLVSNPANAIQLMTVTGAAYDPGNLDATIGGTTLGVLWYNVFATEDAIEKLGGNPYDNRTRIYAGSLNDDLLNTGVKRYRAKSAALDEIANNYETSGVLTKPLVTLHTTLDPIVPIWHQTLYTNKVIGNNPYSPYYFITVERYGHCAFTWSEMASGFAALVAMTTPQMP